MDNHNEILDLYVRDVAERLPRSNRAEISLELSALLRDELEAKAHQLGRPADRTMTLAFLKDFGHPAQVATRYHESWMLVSPADTRSVLTAAIVGIFVIIGVALTAQPISEPDSGRWVLLSMLAWIGGLSCFFAGKSWLHHRWPSLQKWVPRDRERMNRAGGVSLVALIVLASIVYAAPAWVFARLSGGAVLSDWLSYDPAFHQQRLPWLLGLWAAQAVMLLIVTIRGRWSPRLRRAEIVLSLGVAVVLGWFLASGPLFVHSAPDRAARAILGLAIVFILVDTGTKLYRGFGVETASSGVPGSRSPAS